MATPPAETMSISVFKATCLAVLERVRRTGTPVIVTRRGIPVAEVGPPSVEGTGRNWLGAMKGSASITGDIIAPASAIEDWESLGT